MPGILQDILLKFLYNHDNMNTNWLKCAQNKSWVIVKKISFEKNLKNIMLF